jgi:hypothetical protein
LSAIENSSVDKGAPTSRALYDMIGNVPSCDGYIDLTA